MSFIHIRQHKEANKHLFSGGKIEIFKFQPRFPRGALRPLFFFTRRDRSPKPLPVSASPRNSDSALSGVCRAFDRAEMMRDRSPIPRTTDAPQSRRVIRHLARDRIWQRERGTTDGDGARLMPNPRLIAKRGIHRRRILHYRSVFVLDGRAQRGLLDGGSRGVFARRLCRKYGALTLRAVIRDGSRKRGWFKLLTGSVGCARNGRKEERERERGKWEKGHTSTRYRILSKKSTK